MNSRRNFWERTGSHYTFYDGSEQTSINIKRRRFRYIMSNDFKPIHRFFHGDPVEGMPNGYSMSVGDTWLYFNNNHLVGVCKLETDPEKWKDEFYILDNATEKAKEAMANEIKGAIVTMVNIDELAGVAIRLTSAEISKLVQDRLLQNQTE
jgi:hypothetical protein